MPPALGVPPLDTRLKLRLGLVKLFDLLCRLPPWPTLRKVLNHCAATIPDLFFIQIGANDGVIYDPLYHYVRRYRWPGLLVEPARCYFARLQENYRSHPNLIFENAAISDREEQRVLFRIREDCDYLPEWCAGLGSFHREVLLSHRWAIPDLERYVVEESVHCVTLSSLLRKHAVTRVDVLCIDTEGHDHEILRQIGGSVVRFGDRSVGHLVPHGQASSDRFGWTVGSCLIDTVERQGATANGVSPVAHAVFARGRGEGLPGGGWLARVYAVASH